MKKIVAFALALVIILTSCNASSAQQTRELDSALSALFDDIGVATTVFSSESTDAERSALGLGFLYAGEREPLEEFERIKSFSIRLACTDSIFEIHTVGCVHPSDCEVIAEFMKLRARRLNEALKLEGLQNRSSPAKEAEIYVKGHYVFLLATPDNARAKAEIERLL